jgi:hypothetical protein
LINAEVITLAMTKKSIKTNTYLFLLMLFAVPVSAQTIKPAAQKKAPPKAQKAPAPQQKKNPPLRGKLEKLSCKLGSEDRHARIAVELVGGRLKSLAYYSKWKPRTCSVHIVRDDAFSKWEDTGGVTVVTLNEEKGAFLIDYSRTAVKFLFRDIDRERFCGMTGKITGTLTVTRGRDQCELQGVMDEPESLELPKVPVKEVAGEAVREVAKEPVKEPAKEAAKEPAKDSAKDGVIEAPKEPLKEPEKVLPGDSAKEAAKEPPAVAPKAP